MGLLSRYQSTPDESQRNGPNSKVRGPNIGPIWGRHDPGGPHDGPMNFAICGVRIKEMHPTLTRTPVIYLKNRAQE